MASNGGRCCSILCLHPARDCSSALSTGGGGAAGGPRLPETTFTELQGKSILRMAMGNGHASPLAQATGRSLRSFLQKRKDRLRRRSSPHEQRKHLRPLPLFS